MDYSTCQVDEVVKITTVILSNKDTRELRHNVDDFSDRKIKDT